MEVFRSVAPAVVFVTKKDIVRDRWSMRALEVPAGSGTGFIWDAKGHIVTNFHVVDQGRAFTITLFNDKTYPARFIGGDPRKDLAVLKIEPPPGLINIRVAPKGSGLQVGQKTLAIGNPFGLDHTLTVGVISALGREVKGFGGVTIRDMIQTDASINPGNSGGPLLNSSGELIGMNTMIYSKSGSSAGIGFALPFKTIRRLVPQIIKFGKPQRAGLGVELVPDEVARRNRIQGVVILKVQRGTPASKAGLEGLRRKRFRTVLGDVIVGINGQKVANFDDLYTALDEKSVGDEVVVEVERDGRARSVKISLIRL